MMDWFNGDKLSRMNVFRSHANQRKWKRKHSAIFAFKKSQYLSLSKVLKYFFFKKIYKFTLALVDKREMDRVKFNGLDQSFLSIHLPSCTCITKEHD